MKRARLVKQKDLLDSKQQQAQEQPPTEKPTVRKAVVTVNEWVKKRRSVEQLSPREQFAALFS